MSAVRQRQLDELAAAVAAFDQAEARLRFWLRVLFLEMVVFVVLVVLFAWWS